MTPDELDELEKGLDPAARYIVAYLRQQNAQLRAQLTKTTEQLANLTEQVAGFKRRLFGKRSEKIPTVRDEIRRQVDPNELLLRVLPC